VERECSWRVLEAPTAGRSGCNPGQVHASPGQTVFLPVEAGPSVLRGCAVDVDAALTLGAAPQGAEHLVQSGQGGAWLPLKNSVWPGLRLFGIGFTPREPRNQKMRRRINSSLSRLFFEVFKSWAVILFSRAQKTGNLFSNPFLTTPQNPRNSGRNFRSRFTLDCGEISQHLRSVIFYSFSKWR